MEIESFEIDSDSDLNTSPIDESFFCYTELSDLLKSRSKMNDPIYWHKKVKRICRGVEKPTDGLENQYYQKPIALIDTRRHEQLRQIKDRVALLKASDNQPGPKIDVCYNDNPFISNPNFLSEPYDDAKVSRLPFDLANNLADGIIIQSSDWLSPFENEIENESGKVNEKLKKKVVNLLINPPPKNIQVNGLKPGDVLPTPYDIVNQGIQGNQKVRYPSYSFIPYGLEQRLPQGTDYKQLFDTSYISKTKVKKSAKKSASKVKANIVQKIYKLQAKIPIAKNKIVKKENIKKNIKNLFQNIPVLTNVEDIPQKGDCILFIYTGTLYGYEKKRIDDVPKVNYLRYKIFHLRNGNIHDDVTQLYDDFHTVEPKAMKNEINDEFFGCYPSKGEDEKIRRLKNINSTIVPFSFSSEDLDQILEVYDEGEYNDKDFDEIVNEGENDGESDENEDEEKQRNLFDIFKLHASKLNIRLTQLQLQTIQPLIEKEKEKKKDNEKQTIVKLAIMFYYLVIFGRSESNVRQYFQNVHSFHWKKIEEKIQAIKTLQFQNVPYEKKIYDAILAKEKEKEERENSSKSNDTIDLTKLYTMNWRFDNEQKTNKTANKNKTTTRKEREGEKASLLLPLNLPKRLGNLDERKIKTMNYDEVQTGVRTIEEKEKEDKNEKEDTQQKNKSKHKKELEVAFKRDAESNKFVSDFLIQKDKDKDFMSKDESVSIMALNSFVLYLVPLVLGKIAYQWLSNNPKISYVKKYTQFNIEHANINTNSNSLLFPLSSVNSVRSLVHDQMMNPKQKGLDHLRFVYLILQSTKNVNQSILKLLKSYLTDLQDQLISKLDDSIDELQMFREQDKIKRMQFLGAMNSEDARAFAQAVRNGIEHYPHFFQDEFERKKEATHEMDVGDGHGGNDE